MILKSDRLKVRIAEPGEYPNVGTRFDHAGFIQSVVLDNAFEFCTEEPHNLRHAWSGGAGICCEYLFDGPSYDCPVGEFFPKFGVGLLKKEAEGGFKGYIRYERRPFEIRTLQKDESGAVFETMPDPCMGYAVRTKREIRAEANRIIMDISLENTGEKEILFEELCHNFQTIEHLPLGPDYDLRMDVAAMDDVPPARGFVLVGKGKGFGFSDSPDQPGMYRLDGEQLDQKTPFSWKLTNRKSPASVSESLSVMPKRVTVWATDHMVCPELICSFCVKPGEEARWTRTWTYEAAGCTEPSPGRPEGRTL